MQSSRGWLPSQLVKPAGHGLVTAGHGWSPNGTHPCTDVLRGPFLITTLAVAAAPSLLPRPGLNTLPEVTVLQEAHRAGTSPPTFKWLGTSNKSHGTSIRCDHPVQCDGQVRSMQATAFGKSSQAKKLFLLVRALQLQVQHATARS